MSGVLETTPLGFLLLRDGHAVPLTGISPDEIKAGAKYRVPNPDAEPMRHRQTLNAIVHRLGFRGDFGDFKNGGWDAFNEFLRANGCGQRASLFPSDESGSIDLLFSGTLGPRRRQLADRIFEADGPPIERVFLGYGIDWANTWDLYRFEGPNRAVASVGGDPHTAGERASALFERRFDLFGQWGFLDDKLIWGSVEHVVDKTYWALGSSECEREAHHAKVFAAVRAFRAVFDARPEGWVDVLRFNDRLAVLRAHDGTWDILWRAYRESDPPQPSDISNWSKLAVEDLPASLMTESDYQRAVHFRQEVWEEREAHEAEQAFYDRGGVALDRQLTSDTDVRIAWLREQGRLPAPERLLWSGEIPPGFRRVEVAGRRLAMSDLVDVATFRRMLVDTGYLERRDDSHEPWHRANEGDAAAAPVGVCWADAQAFCAWKERHLGVVLRLPTKHELRAIHPFHSQRYAEMSGGDFLWEFRPPRPLEDVNENDAEGRIDVPSAVNWSEPRFADPGTDGLDPAPVGRHGINFRKRWIVDFPPRAAWREDLPWAEYSGLRFIDAWDSYEWCHEVGWVHGRFWEGPIGPGSWGAYKNVKVGFRLVLDVGV
jgi:hypothetical protein